MYVKKNIAKPSGGSPGASAPKDPNFAVVAVDDIMFFPQRDSGLVNMLGNFTLKPGAKMYNVYHTPSKTKVGFEPEGDEDTVTYKQKVETEFPGDGLDINEFIANWTGVNVVVIVGSCADNFRKVVGTKCAPLQLKATSQDDNDARKKMLTFEQYAKSGMLPGHYTGELIFSEPTAPANTTFAINAAGGNQYKIPALDVTAAIAPSAVELEHGQVVTFIGSGGEDPATLTSGTAGAAEVVLKGGSDWVALLNAVIHFQVFDAGESKYLIEMSRA